MTLCLSLGLFCYNSPILMNRLYFASLLVVPVMLAAMLLVVLNVFDPLTVGVTGVLVVFMLIYFVFFSLLYVLLRSKVRPFSCILSRFKSNPYPHRKAMNRQRAYLVSSVLALVPIIMLAVGSFSSFGVWDILLIVVFIVVAVLYIQKTTAD